MDFKPQRGVTHSGVAPRWGFMRGVSLLTQPSEDSGLKL